MYTPWVSNQPEGREFRQPHVPRCTWAGVAAERSCYKLLTWRTWFACLLQGTAAILFTAREARSVGQILRQTKTERAEMHGPPPPEEVMTKASRNVLTSLDKVESGVIKFFEPVATQLMSSQDPTRVLAAALAQISGFTQVPQPRSLLTYESGMQTLKLLGEGKGAGAPGRVDGFSSLGKVRREDLGEGEGEGGSTPGRVVASAASAR